MQNLAFRVATVSDIPQLLLLINSAYRQNLGQSWTNEANIVVGDRIHQQQLENLISQPNHQLLIAEIAHLGQSLIIACIGLNYLYSELEIGTFCIAPDWQNQGIGQRVLAYAERYSANYAVQHQMPLEYYVMWVLNVRNELLAYYERRGYVLTGEIEAYPLDANVGQPTVALHLVKMKKPILV